MSENTTVALLGTGTMGAPMARNIAQAGIPVRVWNRTRDKAESLSDVATVSDTVAEAVDGADVVLTVLWDADTWPRPWSRRADTSPTARSGCR